MPTRHDLAATLKRLLKRALPGNSLQIARRNAKRNVRRVTADSPAHCPVHLAGANRPASGPGSTIGFYRSEAFAEDLIELVQRQV